MKAVERYAAFGVASSVLLGQRSRKLAGLVTSQMLSHQVRGIHYTMHLDKSRKLILGQILNP